MRLAETMSPRGTLWAVSEYEVWRYGLLFLLLIAGIVLAKGEAFCLKEGRVAVKVVSSKSVTLASVTLTFFEI